MNFSQKPISLENLANLDISFFPWDIVFLYGDLATGKTTFTQHILRKLLWTNISVKSPTYTYYEKYGENIYHFDLYRVKDYDHFFAIGGEEILDNQTNISFIEWPQILENIYSPSVVVHLKKTEDANIRMISFERKK